MSTQAEASAYALLTDGATIEIRVARPDDFDAVRDMHAKMSPDNLYLRFFSMGPALRRAGGAPDMPRARAGPRGAARRAGRRGGRLRHLRAAAAPAPSPRRSPSRSPMTVQNRGVGTLLLEHLISLARGRGFRAFTAETLTENALMLQVFADAGLPAQRALADGVYDFTFPLPADEADAALGTYRDAVAERERSADVASLRHVLTPASVAVIGASRRPGSVGRAILQNIVTGGFSGPVYAVNPAATELDGVALRASAAALPDRMSTWPSLPRRRPPSLGDRRGMRAAGCQGPGRDRRRAWAARPARTCWASAAATACGWSGRPASAWPTPACAWTRRSRPAIPRPGTAGLALQSRRRRRRRCSSICPGWAWASPPSSPSATRTTCPATTCCCGGSPTRQTKLALLYLESIGNPRKFARTAPARRPHHADPDRERGPVRGGPAAGRSPRRQGGHPAAHQAGPVRAGRA